MVLKMNFNASASFIHAGTHMSKDENTFYHQVPHLVKLGHKDGIFLWTDVYVLYLFRIFQKGTHYSYTH